MYSCGDTNFYFSNEFLPFQLGTNYSVDNFSEKFDVSEYSES